MRDDYILFTGETGQKVWIRLSDIRGVGEYYGGSFAPCNGGSILYVPGNAIGVTMSPKEVKELILKRDQSE